MSLVTTNAPSVRFAVPGPGITVRERVGLGEYMLLAVLLAAAVGSMAALLWQAVSPHPLFGWGLIVDRLSALLTFLVATVGAVTFRFSLRYLDGEPGQARFLWWLFGTVVAAYLLMLSTSLWLLFFAWLVVSLGLHQLLLYYQDRPEALRPARKKFLISRLGDVALLSAVCLIGGHWGTWDVRTFLASSSQDGGPLTALVALLVVAAALTKSAQFPFHSWLPETMEAPTPVSALMHAGIINAGGALVLRFAPLLVRVPAALFVLALFGTATACLGLLAMWAQPNVKRTLAWSTVSQMGFMMAECGMAAFPAAALHIVGHGFYKAWSFLRTGDVPVRAASASLSPRRTLLLFALGSGVGLACVAGAGRWAGLNLLRSPSECGLSLILALSLGQVWVACFRAAPPGRGQNARAFASAVTASLLLSFLAGAVYGGANAFFAPVFLAPASGLRQASGSPLAWASALLPVVALTALCVLYPLLPALMRTRPGRAFHVHALHGFYFGAVADRLVDRLWRSHFHQKVTQEEQACLMSQ